MEALTEVRTAQVPREYYEELTETVRAGLQEQRARERAERAEAARKAREDRDKKRQEERAAAAKARKNNPAVSRRKDPPGSAAEMAFMDRMDQVKLDPFCPSGLFSPFTPCCLI